VGFGGGCPEMADTPSTPTPSIEPTPTLTPTPTDPPVLPSPTPTFSEGVALVASYPENGEAAALPTGPFWLRFDRALSAHDADLRCGSPPVAVSLDSTLPLPDHLRLAPTVPIESGASCSLTVLAEASQARPTSVDLDFTIDGRFAQPASGGPADFEGKVLDLGLPDARHPFNPELGQIGAALLADRSWWLSVGTFDAPSGSFTATLAISDVLNTAQDPCMPTRDLILQAEAVGNGWRLIDSEPAWSAAFFNWEPFEDFVDAERARLGLFLLPDHSAVAAGFWWADLKTGGLDPFAGGAPGSFCALASAWGGECAPCPLGVGTCWRAEGMLGAASVRIGASVTARSRNDVETDPLCTQ
jgi:hypothetical protein